MPTMAPDVEGSTAEEVSVDIVVGEGVSAARMR